jgi:hypothetical protein
LAWRHQGRAGRAAAETCTASILASSRRAGSGQRAEAVMSLIQSARMNGHDPYAYLLVASKASRGVAFSQIQTGRNRAFLGQEHLAFMNFDAIYMELQQLKAKRGWHKLNLGRDMPRALLQPVNDWYVRNIRTNFRYLKKLMM